MIALDIDPSRSTPLYHQIFTQIQAAVADGRLKPGDELWTGRQIAAHYAVSYQTVQRALGLLAQSGTVTRSVRRGTVVATPAAPGQRERGGLIALVNGWPMFGDQPSFTLAEMRMLHGAMAELSAHLRGAFSVALPPGASPVTRLARWAEAHPFDAALLFGPVPESVSAWLVRQGASVARVDAEPDAVPCPCVVQDNEGGIDQSMSYLAGLGHQRIAFLRGGDDVPHYALRRAAFHAACRRLGLSVDPALDIAWRHRSDAEVVTRILKARPSALLVSSDILAVRVMAELRGRGLRVPEDISVTGFDDEPFSQTSLPPLTTVRVPFEEMGREGVRLLLAEEERLEGQAGEPQRIVVPTELVIRSSAA